MQICQNQLRKCDNLLHSLKPYKTSARSILVIQNIINFPMHFNFDSSKNIFSPEKKRSDGLNALFSDLLLLWFLLFY